MKYLSKTEFLTTARLQEVDVEVPNFGSVRIRELTAGDRDWFEASMIHDAQQGKAQAIEVAEGVTGKIAVELFRAKLVALSVVDTETGKRMFDRGDVQTVSQLPSRVINFIADEITKLNAMTKEEIEKIKNVSSSTGDGASDSASPEISGELLPSSELD